MSSIKKSITRQSKTHCAALNENPCSLNDIYRDNFCYVKSGWYSRSLVIQQLKEVRRTKWRIEYWVSESDYFLNRRKISAIIMVDRANIKQMIPALPDEKIGNYTCRVKEIRLFDSAPPSDAIYFHCSFNNCIVLIAHCRLA